MEVSIQASVSAVTSNVPNQTIPRRSANFHPTVWGEHFLTYASDTKESSTDEEELEHARLKEEVRNILNGIPDKSREKLDFIDNIQRLGLSYHFETEINAAVLNIFNAYNDCAFDEDDNDLYVVALRFRLLRQNRHHSSCDHAFNKFKNSEGKFKESVVRDLKGMLSLYEASNYRVHGENYLEEALIFTTSQLESMLPNLRDFRATQVKQALDHPIRKSLTRLGALQYIPIYQEAESHNDGLLNLAKLDFNRLQKLHRMELSEITKWWKDLDCAKNFPFARDRLVECYFWALAVYFEPHYGLARRFLTKAIAMASIIDDIYDAYGTLDELISFTDAIERWDIQAINQLPTYTRLYQFVLDVYTEMEEELAKEGNSYRVNYAKEELKKFVRAYTQEAYWCHNDYVPTFDECIKVSLTSCGYTMLATTAMVGMGDSATKESFDWVTNEPQIVQAISIICRFTDDIIGYESEKERGDMAFTVEGYMKEYDVSKQEAFDELWKKVKNAWKDVNGACLNATAISTPFLERILNLARVIDLLYKDIDGYTDSKTKAKELITFLLVNPVR